MLTYLIKVDEKILCGFGFGLGMGISFKLLPNNKQNTSISDNYYSQ